MVAKVRKSKKLVTVAQVRDAVAALSERNGSSVKSIFNYLVWKRQANSGARKQVVLTIAKAVKAGALVKKSGKGFTVAGNQPASRPGRKIVKRKSKRAKRRGAKKSSKRSIRARRRRQTKRKALKKKARKASKKASTAVRKPVKSRKRKVNKKAKSVINAKPVLMKRSKPPRRKCTIGVRYTA